MSVFGLLHALLRTLLILGCSVPFFALNFSHADWLAAAVVLAVGSISLIGLGILTGILPMLYPGIPPKSWRFRLCRFRLESGGLVVDR
jgi:hypothetical protein